MIRVSYFLFFTVANFFSAHAETISDTASIRVASKIYFESEVNQVNNLAKKLIAFLVELVCWRTRMCVV